MSPAPSPTINSIGVIVGRDLVGDALIKLPFLRSLRGAFPQAQIHWITSQGPTAYSSVLRDVTRHLIDEVHECPAWMNNQPQTSPHFDLLIDTRNRWRMAREAQQVPHGLFLAPAFRYLFSDRRPPLFRARPPHMVDRLLEMVELAHGSIPPSTGRLPVPEEMLAKARQILPPGPVYVGLAPGAGNRIKAWPRYKFEKLAALQAQRGHIPVFLLGPQELSWYDEMLHAAPSARFPLQAHDVWGSPLVTIEQTLAIGSLLNVAVANDSGTGHMLAAVDCPLISLFGPTSPTKLAPKLSRGLVIKSQDFGSNQVRAITWETVDAAIENFVLNEKTPRN